MNRWRFSIWLAAWALVWQAAPSVQTEVPVVHAVLFYSPSCPHCHQVITEDLPPLLDEYGEQLLIVGVDTSSAGGQVLFQSAIDRFSIPPEEQVVPMLILDDVILLGSLDIPERLPGLVDVYLAQGGVDWPDIPGLREALATAQPSPSLTAEQPAPSTTPTQPEPLIPPTSLPTAIASPDAATPSPTSTASNPGLILAGDPPTSLLGRLSLDPVGNSLAILVLIIMLLSVGGVLVLLLSSKIVLTSRAPSLAIPILCLVGFVIAGYLAYVETAQVTAVCGPVGDCNTVQQSEYASLFGVLPIGILGLAGYLAILVTWLGSRFGNGRIASLASVALLGLTFSGTLFSIYLTILEPFVIGATCAWCLSSAAIMTALMWLSIAPGKLALNDLLKEKPLLTREAA
jgi:uncharacterized membrane protein/thiol-disulfide isomerase/thioredoxin